MTWLKSLLRSTAKVRNHTHSWTLVFLLIPIFTLVISIKSSANNLGTQPTIAAFNKWNGYVRMRRGKGQATRINANSLLRSNTDVLEVPGSNAGNEHWAHLQFRLGLSTVFPLVQAGTDSSSTKYRFPCYYQEGVVVIGWGLGNSRDNACERITIDSTEWRSSVSDNNVAQKSRLHKGSKDTFIAQVDAGQLTIDHIGGSTLIYIHQNFGRRVVDVLVGSVRVRSATGSPIIVREGIRYTDASDGRRGSTNTVPEEVYNSRPIQIFLDPNNWSQDIRPQIEDFQQVLDSTQNKPRDDGNRIRSIPDRNPPNDPDPDPTTPINPTPTPETTTPPRNPTPTPEPNTPGNILG
ncbi:MULTISPECIES: hypothetical protein [Moorena]|uniref:Uncharacterized protein n=1 Tax=Moorena producens 3L TaxID=489825 RepID=F4XJ58_9CYAN|nr:MULTISPECIES: hypothetical protein [Moorena]EGJ35138.1 hypothetical protein LYNGBM3L_08690 [Moorena producens 3L]NEP65021.1 hypothetical protein [Moorena sp. SIO3A5]OLT65202.1 hypothetical protein BI334_09275 [Moorena producens 3L]